MDNKEVYILKMSNIEDTYFSLIDQETYDFIYSFSENAIIPENIKRRVENFEGYDDYDFENVSVDGFNERKMFVPGIESKDGSELTTYSVEELMYMIIEGGFKVIGEIEGVIE